MSNSYESPGKALPFIHKQKISETNPLSWILTDYCNSETRKTEQWQADAFHRKEDCRLFAHAAAAGHSCCIPGRQLLNGQSECMKKPEAKPSFFIPFIIRPAHGGIPAALSSGQRSHSGAKMSVSQSAMQNMQRQPYYTGRYTAPAARTNYISPKFCKRCFCLRCRASNAQPYM